MTSISPAQSRPPSLNLRPGFNRVLSRSGPQIPKTPAKEDKHTILDNDIDPVYDRPIKRRKTSTSSLAVSAAPVVDQHVPASVKGQSAPWSTVLQLNTEHRAERLKETALPPLPDRPWRTMMPRETSWQDARATTRVRKNIAVPNTPDCLGSPTDAPLFEQKRRADYFPWTGKHPEDVLNEVHVKQGYFDRPPNPPEKELNTAKPPLYNAFKHRSGLESLSALFSLVLDAKAKHGALSSTSTFKGPPPRVTLTEAKRKSWISDLANPDIPLRRLSKTIPQGIRGPSLLEQCLQNNIPLGRAIWFTKCVGANEIRTLKRKGVNPTVSQGAEIKWLREWTANTAQFIESILAQCGQENWKERIRYSILLVARLYLENLLDRDHYLDWILKSLANATSNHWPFWLMMVHLHRMDLVAFRKRGKQLAEALVIKHNLAQAAPGGVLKPLALNFAAAIRPLMVARPNCFLMPDRWSECDKALSTCLELGNESDHQTFEYLKFVNERASGGVRQEGTAPASPLEQVVEILDSYRVPTSITSLYDSLRQVCPDQELLMHKCLEWCVSKYRSGSTRIYLTARLFRRLSREGCNVDKILLNFIFNKEQATTKDTTTLKHFASELSRSNTFPISKYMQWLSVRGLPHPGTIYERSLSAYPNTDLSSVTFQQCSDNQQLLSEICLLHTEDHVRNLRNSLLRYGGWDEDIELNLFDSLRSIVTNLLYASGNNSTVRQRPLMSFNQVPWTVRTRFTYWLRTEVASLAKAFQLDVSGNPPLPGVKSLTLERFQIVRDVLEEAQDLAILADVLRITASSRHEEILAAAVDTINMHSTEFHAIGALEPLQAVYGQTYVALRSVKPAMPVYATALMRLCQQTPIKGVPFRALQQDFIRGDRGRAVTACSPFSDGVAESLQQAGATFHDDFEAILQTETNMNEQTMIRLFKVLVERIEKTQFAQDRGNELFVLCQLLARLKLCHQSQGEALIKKWVVRLCSMQNQSTSPQLLHSLVCTQCVSLDVITETCQQLPAASNFRSRFYKHVRQAMLNEPELGIDESLFYGFKLAVSKLITTRPAELLDIIGLDESGRSSLTPTKPRLIAAVLLNSELIKTLSKASWLVVSQTLSETLSFVNSSDSPEVQARALATSVGPLSLPYCSLRMRMLCQNNTTKNDEHIQDNIADMLCATAADPTSSLSTSPRTFQTLLRATGPVLSGKVRFHMEQAFFNALPRFLQSKGLAQPPLPTAEEIERTTVALQHVVLVSMDTATPLQNSGTSGVIEKLTIYMKSLGPSSSTMAPVLGGAAASSPVATSAPPLMSTPEFHAFLIASLDHLHLLLRLLCIKRSVLSTTPSQAAPGATKTLQQDQIKLVGLLITIGTHPVWTAVLTSITDRAQQGKIQGTMDFAFDVAATLVDDMSDESRTFCARILKDKTRDERVRWLLGSVNAFGSVQSHDMGQGYQVAHDSKGVLGDWKPKMWEMLESAGSGDSCLGLGLFGAARV